MCQKLKRIKCPNFINDLTGWIFNNSNGHNLLSSSNGRISARGSKERKRLSKKLIIWSSFTHDSTDWILENGSNCRNPVKTHQMSKLHPQQNDSNGWNSSNVSNDWISANYINGRISSNVKCWISAIDSNSWNLLKESNYSKLSVKLLKLSN